jgi:hypothetical protein
LKIKPTEIYTDHIPEEIIIQHTFLFKNKRRLLSKSVSLFVTRYLFVFFTFQHLTTHLILAATLNIKQMCKTRMGKILQIRMKTAISLETSIKIQQITRHHVLENRNLHSQHRESLKPKIFLHHLSLSSTCLPFTRLERRQKGDTSAYGTWQCHKIRYYIYQICVILSRAH